MSQKDSDIQKIKELIDIMKDNDLAEIEIQHGTDKVLLRRSEPHHNTMVTSMPMIGGGIPAMHAGAEAGHGISKANSPESEKGLLEIKSPIVGTFYSAPSPDSEPYIEQGSQVNPNTVVCIIEAMKVMNEIKAETSGTITQILVTNGQAVEYGQVLFKFRPE